MLFLLSSWEKVEFGVTRKQSHFRVKQSGLLLHFVFVLVLEWLVEFSIMPLLFMPSCDFLCPVNNTYRESNETSYIFLDTSFKYVIFLISILISIRSCFLLFNLNTKITKMPMMKTLPHSILSVCFHSLIIKRSRHFATLVFSAIVCMLVNILLVPSVRNSLWLSSVKKVTYWKDAEAAPNLRMRGTVKSAGWNLSSRNLWTFSLACCLWRASALSNPIFVSFGSKFQIGDSRENLICSAQIRCSLLCQSASDRGESPSIRHGCCGSLLCLSGAVPLQGNWHQQAFKVRNPSLYIALKRTMPAKHFFNTLP